MKTLVALLVFTLPLTVSFADYTFSQGRLLPSEEVATLTVQEHYSAALEAYQKGDWEELLLQGTIVVKNFPESPFAQDASFFIGVSYYQLSDFELANKHFTSYLKKQTAPKYFEEAIQYKFLIAEQFHHGARRHLMGWRNLPKWLPAKEEALAIYEEVITALPHHELAAQSLFGKAILLLQDDEFKGSVEAYQTLIRRFPKHPLAVESYLGIGNVYLTQCQKEYPDPDFLDLSEINLKKFRRDFPGEERLESAEKMVAEMKEIYAANLFETGDFYRRTKKPSAAMIYYNKILNSYPDTPTADKVRAHLEKLSPSPVAEAE